MIDPGNLEHALNLPLARRYGQNASVRPAEIPDNLDDVDTGRVDESDAIEIHSEGWGSLRKQLRHRRDQLRGRREVKLPVNEHGMPILPDVAVDAQLASSHWLLLL